MDRGLTTPLFFQLKIHYYPEGKQEQQTHEKEHAMFEDILKYLNTEFEYYEDEDPYLIELEDPNDPKSWVDYYKKYPRTDFVQDHFGTIQQMEIKLDPSVIKETNYTPHDVVENINKLITTGTEPPLLKTMLMEVCLLKDDRPNVITMNKIEELSGSRIFYKHDYGHIFIIQKDNKEECVIIK